VNGKCCFLFVTIDEGRLCCYMFFVKCWLLIFDWYSEDLFVGVCIEGFEC